jgi:Alpha 1,4-glycosyltransferase conserved region
VYELGPRAFTTAIESFCDKPAYRLLQDRQCLQKDVAIFNQSLIGPYQYTEVNNYFEELNDVQYEKLSRKAVAFHVFNKISKKKKLALDSKSIYARAARDFCPISISTCKNQF